MGRDRKDLAVRDDRVASNARLTGGAAALLLVLLAAQGATIPFIGRLVGAHIFIGALLVPPVLVKLGSTGYRFARYYARDPAYRRKGPPPLAMRLLAPGVVLTTLALFGTGAALTLSARGSALSLLHKVSFIVWLPLMTAHVLGHVLEVPRLALPDWRRSDGRLAGPGGSRLRIAVLAGSLLVGLALALAVSFIADPWLSATGGGD